MSSLTNALLIANLTVVISSSIFILREIGKLNKKIDIVEENLHADIGVNTTRLAWEISEQKKNIKEIEQKLASKEYVEEEFNCIRARLTKEFGITNNIILKNLENKATKEDIRLSIKGELADEISKLAFTPLKIDLRK